MPFVPLTVSPFYSHRPVLPVSRGLMSQSTVLYRLQKFDLEIDAHRHRLRQITALLEQDAARQEAQAAVIAFQEALRPQEIRAKDLTLEMQSITTQSGQLHSRLYGGKVSNPKELQEME